MKTPDHPGSAPPETPRLDDAVRRALEPPPHQVERVLHVARSAPPAPSTLRRSLPWAAAASLLLALVSFQLRTPESSVDPRSETTETAVLSLSNASGLVQLTAGGGTRLLVVPVHEPERSPR